MVQRTREGRCGAIKTSVFGRETLEEMKDKGFSGAMIFDADGSSQRGNRRTEKADVIVPPEQ